MNPDGSDHKVIVTDCQFLVLAEERPGNLGAAFRKVRAGSLEGPFSQNVESEGRDRSLRIDSS